MHKQNALCENKRHVVTIDKMRAGYRLVGRQRRDGLGRISCLYRLRPALDSSHAVLYPTSVISSTSNSLVTQSLLHYIEPHGRILN
jgi:hypothetical protein